MKSRHDILSGDDMLAFRSELSGMNQVGLAELMNKSEDDISRMEKLGEGYLESDSSDMLCLVYDVCKVFRKNAEDDVIFNRSSPAWTAIKIAVHREAQTGSLRQGSRLGHVQPYTSKLNSPGGR